MSESNSKASLDGSKKRKLLFNAPTRKAVADVLKQLEDEERQRAEQTQRAPRSATRTEIE